MPANSLTRVKIVRCFCDQLSRQSVGALVYGFKDPEIDRVEIDRFVGFVALVIDSLYLIDQIDF